MLRRDMADIASDHLFLRQRLLPVPLRAVVVIVMHHGTAAVVPEFRRRHRRSLQVPAQIFDASPGSPGLLRKGLCRIKKSSDNMLFFLRCYLTMPLIRKAFKRLHYPVDIIAQCVRWYLAYSLSLRNLEEIMAERGITVDHSTLHRWIIRLVPLLDKAFRRHKRAVGRRWRMDETYIRVRGQWKYLYRAVDTEGQTIDFLLTAKRDTAAALRFFRKAIRQHGEPEVVTIDKSGANTAALATINANKSEEEIITIRQNKHLNNLIEQDHRNIKRRIRLMLGFKSFRRAQTLLAGIELINMIRKGQYQHPQSDGLSPAEQFYLLAA